MPNRTIECPQCGEQIPIGDYENYGTSHTCPKCGCEVINWSDPEPRPKRKVYSSSNNNKGSHSGYKRTTAKTNAVEYNSNFYAVLSIIFAFFLPWFIGYPFGVIGDKRALKHNDIASHSIAVVGKVISIIMMVIYGLAIIISLWMIQGWMGAVSLFAIIIVYAIYFGLAYYFTHN